MLNVLAVSGSPRRGGNTEILVNAAVQPFSEEGHRVHKFFLSEKSVGPCIACEMCADGGVCVLEDDFSWLLDQALRCDAVIIGSPVYQRNITAQLLAVFSRFHCVMHDRPFKDKIVFGGAIAVGGSPNSQGITLAIIHNFLLSLGVCCVPAVINGVSVVARAEGEVLGQPKSLDDAKVLGENLLKVLKK
jgi:multimeric flavodoxin WrbA